MTSWRNNADKSESAVERKGMCFFVEAKKFHRGFLSWLNETSMSSLEKLFFRSGQMLFEFDNFTSLS